MRNVLITGGSRGIGAACVRAFCEMGDRVVFLYRSCPEQEVRRLESETGALGLRVDLSKPAEAVAGAEEAVRMLDGRPDVLVNNAGISQIRLFDELTDADWRRMMAFNLDSAFYVTRTVAKAMIRRQRGRIVNVGSMWGKCGASCEVHYSTAKAGLRGFTMALAKEVTEQGITVNSIVPGMIRSQKDVDGDCKGQQINAINRSGTPEECAQLIAFLASDNAAYISGQNYKIDGCRRKL